MVTQVQLLPLSAFGNTLWIFSKINVYSVQVLWWGWCLVEILKLMLGRDSEDEIWSRYVFELVIWTQPSGPLCLWQCFGFNTPVLFSTNILLRPFMTWHIYFCNTIIKECLTKQIIQEARMKTSLLRQQTTSTSGKDFEPPLLFFRSALLDQFYIHSCSQYWHSFRNSEPLLKRIWKCIQISKP